MSTEPKTESPIGDTGVSTITNVAELKLDIAAFLRCADVYQCSYDARHDPIGTKIGDSGVIREAMKLVDQDKFAEANALISQLRNEGMKGCKVNALRLMIRGTDELLTDIVKRIDSGE